MEKQIYFNSWSEDFRQPFGAIQYEELLKIKISVSDPHVQQVSLALYLDGENPTFLDMYSEPGSDDFKLELHLERGYGLYFYYFRLQTEEGVYYYGNNFERLGGEGQLYHEEDELVPYQLTAYAYDDPAPNWYLEGIAYHIFVDRFDNGNPDGKIDHPKPNAVIYTHNSPIPHYVKGENGEILHWDFYGGNLKGVIKHLDYLADMGVTLLYLNPIFEAPSNHKYDTGDYFKIDPMFGDDEIFDDLIAQAQKKGIKIMLDGVFNHTGADSIYFNKFGNYDHLGAFQSTESPYADWYYFKDHPDEYDGWWGDKNLPRLNTEKTEVRAFFYGEEEGVVSYWIKRGIAGWRIDVADELTDEFLQDLRQAMMKADPETVLIGEVWEDASNKISYDVRRKYIYGGSLHGVMNYPLRKGILALLRGEASSTDLAKHLMSLKENYPASAFYASLNNLGSHDTERLASMLEADLAKIKLAYVMMVMLPGVPTIYYGDELALEGGKDPDNRRPFQWQEEETDLQQFLPPLMTYRKDHRELVVGNFYPLSLGSIFGIFREDNEKGTWTLCLLNSKDQTREINMEDLKKQISLVASSTIEINEEMIAERLAALSFRIINSQGQVLEAFS